MASRLNYQWTSRRGTGATVGAGYERREMRVTTVMHSQIVSWVFFGLMAGAVPVMGAPAGADTAAAIPDAAAPVAVQRVSVPPVRDETAMVLVGTALIGLAAAVRRAT
jgi:hypothetical protein